jgi:hypothetical protein
MKRGNYFDRNNTIKDSRRLPKGAYICKIVSAKEDVNQYGTRLLIAFDISEGEYAGFYQEKYNASTSEDKKWSGVIRLNVPAEDGSEADAFRIRSFNSAIVAIEESNPGYMWDWNERALKGKNIGSIGKPSSWLIASNYSPDAMMEKLGLGFVDISMEEMMAEYEKKSYPDNEHVQMFKSMGYDEAEMEKALYVYGALERLVDKYNLCGVTIRCFDLLDTVFTTGCIGLSILNNKGIYGGCEGDVPVLLSMAVLGAITGEDMFLCNANKFDTREGTATFAHCTIPTTMLKSFTLNTHFESDIGVAVQGTFDEFDCTIFKCEGDLSRYHAQEGHLKPIPFSNMLCRTQCKVELDDFSYFLTKPINNHHLICRGNHKAEVEAFFRLIEG